MSHDIINKNLKGDFVIEIRYHNSSIKSLCTDFKKARKELPINVARKLHALISFLECAQNLADVANMLIYHIHPLQGSRKGQYALDIAGRRAGYRLIIIPLDINGNEYTDNDISNIYNSTEIILLWEVTNHYE